MSQENIETLRRLAEAFGRRDFDQALESFDEDIEVRPAVAGVDLAALYRGRRIDAVEAPGERVVAVERWRFRGRDGLELESELVDVYTFRRGLIVSLEGFGSRAEALEAVGLSE